MITACECPIDLDERTELYCLGRLRTDEALRFESHLALCPACLLEVFDTDLFLVSMIGALDEIESERAARQPARQ